MAHHQPADQHPAGGPLAAALAAVAAVANDPEALARVTKALASGDQGRDASGATSLPDTSIVDHDANGVVPNPKGKDTMRIFGPYPHGTRFRILIRLGNEQRVQSFSSEIEAQAEVRRLRTEAQKQASITVQKAIAAYAALLRRNGLKEGSVDTAVFRLNRLFKPVLSAPLATVTPAQAREMYQSLSGLSVDTRLNMLASAKKFCRVARENRWTDTLLLQDVKPEGRRKCGKKKLTLDESRKYLATCLMQATSTDSRVRQAAIAACMPLVFGMRSGEVLGLVVKDIDDGGQILRITSAKTRAGIRSLQIPEWFQPHLASLTKDQPSDARLFPREKTWLHRHCVNMCKLAGVSRVVPHGLRGVHADLSILAAATPLQVSEALGHTNTGITFRHYADKNLADQQQHQQAVLSLVPTPNPPN